MADEYGQFVEWIDSQEDGDEIRKARALLAAWRQHAERGSAERDAAIRLDIRCERRLGQLPEMAPKRPGPSKIVTASHEPAHAAERKALSRARALAAIPQAVFEEKIAEPKPSRVLPAAFGRAIRELRTRTGLSQEALAERAGLHRTYIGGIEGGERNVSLVNIGLLADCARGRPRDVDGGHSSGTSSFLRRPL